MSLVLCTSLTISYTYGQLSPGPLTQPHAELEGIKNCTQCHDIGNRIPDTKCLSCHTEIESLIDQNRGYHASIEVKQAECVDCHSEHHGKNFDMVRFDQENFDHKSTGYALKGQHEIVDCRACHKAEFISDPKIGSRDRTFIGLEAECLQCHHDYHQQSLSQDCIACHDFEAFSPAPLFDHDEANFILRGEHTQVDCNQCHQKIIKNGVAFQAFSGLKFGNCVSCHDNPHGGPFTANCTSCHTESSFSNFNGTRNFDHTATGFELKGSHQTNNCFTCHNRQLDPRLIFQEFDNIGESDCISCHEDIHVGKFGTTCVECHNEESFLMLNDIDLFDHSLTDYPLEGSHTSVDCKKCHLNKYTDPIDFAQCKSCHEDYHLGEFVSERSGSDCVDCHSIDHDFTYTLYTLDQHQNSAFPLEASHLATPCFSCHLQDDRWTFKNIGAHCVDCHTNIHDNFIDEKYYPDQDCASCHSSDTWSNIEFDHGSTDWVLEGSHATIDCASCHFEYDSLHFSYIQVFSELGNDCINCHENIHGNQFEVEGITDCKRCHRSENWSPDLFNHSLTKFPLNGKHRGLECTKCHISEMAESFKSYTVEKFECIDCHF